MSDTIEQRAVKILESISDAIYALNADCRFTYVNRRAEQLLLRLVPAVLANYPGARVRLELRTAPCRSESGRANLLALIVNELVSNAVLHALPSRSESGTRTLRVVWEAHNSRLQLVVQDDRPGLPPGFDPQQDGTSGCRWCGP